MTDANGHASAIICRCPPGTPLTSSTTKLNSKASIISKICAACGCLINQLIVKHEAETNR